MATPTCCDPKFEVTPVPGGHQLENAKVSIGKLYLRQFFGGNSRNQRDVVEGEKERQELGKTVVNNWGIYDGRGPEAKLVAKSHGMHAKAGKWNNWFTLEFEVGRFKGSTLQVMGANDENQESEWAIVGGTGQFAMARGIIKRKSLGFEQDYNLLTQELTTTEFFCRMNGVVVPPSSPGNPGPRPAIPARKKQGPWGGNGGTLKEFEGKSQRLESLTIYHHGTAEGFQFSYLDEDRQIRTTGIWGINHNRWKNEIKFGPSEYVKEISGHGHRGNPSRLCQFKIVTNYSTYGPFGTWNGTPFRFTVPENETVVGFYGSTDHENYITTIGVYTISK